MKAKVSFSEGSSLNDLTYSPDLFLIVELSKSCIIIRSQAASCSSSKALTYSWSVRCTNDDSSNAAKTRFESSPGFRKTSSKSSLKVDSGALVGGKTYEFTVTVALKASPSTATNMTTTVVVDWSPLEPAILGGQILPI